MTGVVLSCWYILVKIDLPFVPMKDPLNRSFIFDEMVNWLLLLSFTYLLLVSSPDWLRQVFHNLIRKFDRKRMLTD